MTHYHFADNELSISQNIGFHIHSPISYEDFSRSDAFSGIRSHKIENYLNRLAKIKELEIIPSVIVDKIIYLFQYDIIDYIENYDYKSLLQIFKDSSGTLDNYDFQQRQLIKSYSTNNIDYNKLPVILNTADAQNNLTVEITTEAIPNHRFIYMFLHVILSEKEVFLVVDETLGQFFITDANYATKHIGLGGICFNLSSIFWSLWNDREGIQALQDVYKDRASENEIKDAFTNIIAHIQQEPAFATNQTHIRFKDGVPYYAEIEAQDTPKHNYKWIQKQRTEGGISIKTHISERGNQGSTKITQHINLKERNNDGHNNSDT